MNNLATESRDEIRHIADAELRFVEDGERRTIVGYAAVYNSPTSERFNELFGFSEQVMPGAFSESLRSGHDIRADVEHDRTIKLGRSSRGTLRLSEDQRGLRVEIDLSDTTVGRDTAEEVRRGDLSGMSVAFTRKSVQDEFRTVDGQLTRFIRKANLTAITLTGDPAYEATDVSLRSLEAWQDEERRVEMESRERRLKLSEAS